MFDCLSLDYFSTNFSITYLYFGMNYFTSKSSFGNFPSHVFTAMFFMLEYISSYA